MGLFDWIKVNLKTSKQEDSLNSDDSGLTIIGNAEPICPYCEYRFKVMPQKKKKCPNCNNFVRSRTRPIDNKKVLIREDQMEDIDIQWAIKNNNLEGYYLAKAQHEQEQQKNILDHEKIRETLKKRFGKEPNQNDVEWGYLNQKIIESISHGNWVNYREYRLKMAKFLEGEKKYENAIGMWVEIFYLDLHDEISSFIAPGVVKAIVKDAERGNISIDELKKIFIERYDKIRLPGKIAISSNEAWEMFLSQIS